MVFPLKREPLWPRHRMIRQILVIFLLLQLLPSVQLLLLAQDILVCTELLSGIFFEGNGVFLRKAVVSLA